jgi:hypothetical protein
MDCMCLLHDQGEKEFQHCIHDPAVTNRLYTVRYEQDCIKCLSTKDYPDPYLS